MKASNVAVLTIAIALLACGDGQAGSDYRGEPLMSMRGVVRNSSVPLSTSLVPALMFEPDLDELLGDAATTFFVHGEVEGAFPNSFTMRVYDAPDQQALMTPVPGEPAMAHGQIVAIDPDHPAWLRLETTYDDEGQIETLCADSGQCLTSDYSECPFEDTGEPAPPWPCSQTFPDLPWETYGYSQRHAVMYLDSEAAADGVMSRLFAGGAPITRGYHLLEYTDPALSMTAEQLAAMRGCQISAQEQAIAKVNQIHGTEFTSANVAPIHSDVTLARDYFAELYRAMAQAGCTFSHRIVPAEATPVELEFTDQPGTAAF